VTTQPRRRGIGIPVMGILLVSAGVIALLNTTGALSWSVWWDMWRLWPMLLVLWGLNIIFHRFHPIIIGAVVLAFVAVVVGFAFWADDSEYFRADLENFEYAFTRNEATKLDIDIDFGAGTLNIGALDPSDERAIHVLFYDDEDHVYYESGGIGETIIDAVNKISSLINGPLLAVFLLGMLTRSVNQAGAVTGLIAGFLTNVALWIAAPGITFWWWNIIGLLVAAIVAFPVSALTPGPAPARLHGNRFSFGDKNAAAERGPRWQYAVLAAYAGFIFLVLWLLDSIT